MLYQLSHVRAKPILAHELIPAIGTNPAFRAGTNQLQSAATLGSNGELKRAVFFVAALILGLVGSFSALADAQVAIRFDQSTFGRYEPPNVSINVGETVNWRNEGAFTHTITRCPGSPCEAGNGGDGFDSGNVNVGGTFSKKFESSGSHNYYCKIHQNMRGTVNVAGSSGDAAPPSGGGTQPPGGRTSPRPRPTSSPSPTTASDQTAPPEDAGAPAAQPASQPSPSPASTVRTAADSSGGFPWWIVIALVIVVVAGTVMWRIKKSPS
jgi:plastocyanin